MYRLLSKLNAEKINYFALFLLAFSINFPQKIVIYTIAFWLLTCLPTLKFKKNNEVRSVINTPLLLLIFLFTGRVLMSIYHADFSTLVTKQLLDTQLALLLLPFILIFQVNKLIEPSKVLIVYIVGCFVSSIIAVIYFYLFRFGILNAHAHLLLIPLRDLKSSFVDDLVLFQSYISEFYKHRASVGFNLSMAVASSIYLINSYGKLKFSETISILGVSLTLILVLYATGSRAGLFSLYIVIYSGLVYLFYKNWKVLFLSLTLATITFSLISNLKTTRPLLGRETVEDGQQKVVVSDPRFLIWDACVGLIIQHPMVGHGYKEVRPSLIKKYKESGYKLGTECKFNSHNQFFQFALESGIWTSIIFALILLPIYYNKKVFYLSFSFSAAFTIYCMFEDTLLLINGVSAFTLFMALLIIESKKREKEITY